MAEDLQTLITTASDPNTATFDAIRRAIIFQNLFYLDRVFDGLQEAGEDLL